MRIQIHDNGGRGAERRTDAYRLVAGQSRHRVAELSTKDTLDVLQAGLIEGPQHDVALALRERRLADHGRALGHQDEAEAELPCLEDVPAALSDKVGLIAGRTKFHSGR